MINYYLGIPGSGKSYSGVNTIYNNFSDNKDAKKDLKKKYENCYTNINEFKFYLVKDVYLFDFDVFLEQITTLYDMYKKKANDDELIVKAKEFKIYKTLFVLDECHQYFDVEKKVLVWWLTYHRHLYHDIILITQNLALVNSKYKPLAEAFYKAKSSSLTLNKKFFNYMYFTESRMTKASYVNNKKVLKRKAVFELYQSGDSVKSKNVILHFLSISLIFVFILVALAYYFYNSFTPGQEEKEHIPKNMEVPTVSKSASSRKVFNHSKSIDVDYSDKKLLILNCSTSVCSNDSVSLPPKLVFKFASMELLHILYKEEISKFLTIVYISTNSDFYNFLYSDKGAVSNETHFDTNNLFGSSSSG